MRKIDEYARRILQPLDDAVTENGNEKVVEKVPVYFLDLEAMIHYAGPLYGSFLVEQFVGSYIVPGEDNIYITDEDTLEKLKRLEAEGAREIYPGYEAFIERNVVIIPNNIAIKHFTEENTYHKWVHGSVIAFNTDPCATVLGSLFYLEKRAKVEPLLITFDDEMARVAMELGYKVINK